MNTNTDFAKYLSKFLSGYLPHERNMSPNTVSSYRDTFVLLINYMKMAQKIQVERLCLNDITKQVVTDFLSWIISERGCGVSTRNNRLAAIHSFVQYLQYEDVKHLVEWQKILSIKVMKSEPKKMKYLSTEGIEALLDQLDAETYSGRRDILGHSSIQTTEIYARVDSKQKQEALEKAYVDLIPRSAKTRQWEQNKDLLSRPLDIQALNLISHNFNLFM